MPSVVTPPLRDDVDFQQGRKAVEDALAGQAPSPDTPAYADAFRACLGWVVPFVKERPK